MVASEGESLNNIINDVRGLFDMFLASGLNFNILIKGTSSSDNFKTYAGVPPAMLATVENVIVYAYAIIPSGIPSKTMNNYWEIIETPSFNSIFDAAEAFSPELVLYLKAHLVPITAEEFYN